MGLPARIGQDKIYRIGVGGVACYFSINFCPPFPGIFQTFEGVDAPPFRADNSIAVFIEGTAGFCRVFVLGKRAFTFKAGKNSEGVDTFRNSTGQGKVDFPKPQHLDSLNHPHIAGGTSRTNGVMGTRDFHVQGDFAGRVVGYGSRVMMMRPVLHIIIKLADIVDFVFRFYVSMLGGSQINPDS